MFPILGVELPGDHPFPWLERPDEGRPRLGDVPEEIEEDEVDVLDLVGAGPDELVREHRRGDVAAHPHAALVGVGDDHRHELRLDRAVDLDLRITERGVPGDRVVDFLLRVHENFRRTLVRPRAVHEAGGDHARTDFEARIEALAPGLQLVGVVGEVADGGDAGCDVQQSIVVADVHVHVPETRN